MYIFVLYLKTAQALYKVFIPLIRLVLAQVHEVSGVVVRLHNESSLVSSLCDYSCFYARIQWRLVH
jgi:hypothetical protein